jgi:endonuclease/exonuclease/phosphatase family metal-dependent hydrolase
VLVVMTFNLRFNNPKDGLNAWPYRREATAAAIRRVEPDLVGTQEGLAGQLAELEALLPSYTGFGVGRRGGEDDEHCRVFFRTASLRLRRHGEFWLSDTPDSVGSISPAWGNTLPRMATWGEFSRVEDGRVFTFVNTHLDHASAVARENAARQLVGFLRRTDVTHPAILAGDLNAAPDSLPLKLLTGRVPVEGEAGLLRDAGTLTPSRRDGEATFHGFTGQGSERIDYLLIEPPLRVIRHHVFDEPVDGRWPSDHFPVVASLAWE